MSRLRLKIFVGICMWVIPFRILYSCLPRHSILWGLCEMCLAATHDFAGIGAVRFLLGFTEGAVAPSFMIITSNWYCRREHPIRIAYVLKRPHMNVS
jgi:MFS family permease